MQSYSPRGELRTVQDVVRESFEFFVRRKFVQLGEAGSVDGRLRDFWRRREVSPCYFPIPVIDSAEKTFAICSSVRSFFSRTIATTVLPVLADSFATSAAAK